MRYSSSATCSTLVGDDARHDSFQGRVFRACSRKPMIAKPRVHVRQSRLSRRPRVTPAAWRDRPTTLVAFGRRVLLTTATRCASPIPSTSATGRWCAAGNGRWRSLPLAERRRRAACQLRHADASCAWRRRAAGASSDIDLAAAAGWMQLADCRSWSTATHRQPVHYVAPAACGMCSQLGLRHAAPASAAGQVLALTRDGFSASRLPGRRALVERAAPPPGRAHAGTAGDSRRAVGADAHPSSAPLAQDARQLRELATLFLARKVRRAGRDDGDRRDGRGRGGAGLRCPSSG